MQACNAVATPQDKAEFAFTRIFFIADYARFFLNQHFKEIQKADKTNEFMRLVSSLNTISEIVTNFYRNGHTVNHMLLDVSGILRQTRELKVILDKLKKAGVTCYWTTKTKENVDEIERKVSFICECLESVDSSTVIR